MDRTGPMAMVRRVMRRIGRVAGLFVSALFAARIARRVVGPMAAVRIVFIIEVAVMVRDQLPVDKAR
ncbi:MAG: hypothetical protein NVS3B21_36740 [Acidimicrobiales bacterium]